MLCAPFILIHRPPQRRPATPGLQEPALARPGRDLDVPVFLVDTHWQEKAEPPGAVSPRTTMPYGPGVRCRRRRRSVLGESGSPHQRSHTPLAAAAEILLA